LQCYIYSPNIAAQGTTNLPSAWIWFKAFYEQNSINSETWQWGDPLLGERSFDKIKEIFHQNPPDILGLGSYVWNYRKCMNLAEYVRQTYPDCLIVMGGSHHGHQHDPKWFLKNPSIDIVTTSDRYGEWTWMDLLDQRSTGLLDFDKINGIVYPSSDRTSFVSSSQNRYKRDFKWPTNALAHCRLDVEQMITEIHSIGYHVGYMWETTRGCPYSCVYCDWGGGTHTKVIRKDQDIIRDELKSICELKIDVLRITDANFGIFKEDISTAKLLAEQKAATGYPMTVQINQSKTNKNNLKEIYKILGPAGVTKFFKIAMQSLVPEVKENVKRTDISWEEAIELSSELEQYGVHGWMEMIIGMPGMTVSNMEQEVNQIVESPTKFPGTYYPLVVLPNTPMAYPGYRREFNLDTIKSCSITRPNMMVTDPNFNTYNAQVLQEWGLDEMCEDEIVVGCSSYTRDDWCEMFLLQAQAEAAFRADLLGPIYTALKKHLPITPSRFLKEVFNPQVFRSEHLDPVKEQIQDFVHERQGHIFAPIETGMHFPFKLTPQAYYELIIALHKDVWVPRLSSRFRIIENEIKDTAATILDPWYKPGQKVEMSSGTCIVLDDSINVGPVVYPLDWQEQPDENIMTHFCYRMVYDYSMANKRASRIIYAENSQK